jgi:hypothetical protein
MTFSLQCLPLLFCVFLLWMPKYIQTLSNLVNLANHFTLSHQRMTGRIRHLAATIFNSHDPVCPMPALPTMPLSEVAELEVHLHRSEEELQLSMRDFQVAEMASHEIPDKLTCFEQVTNEFLNRALGDRKPANPGHKIPDPPPSIVPDLPSVCLLPSYKSIWKVTQLNSVMPRPTWLTHFYFSGVRCLTIFTHT